MHEHVPALGLGPAFTGFDAGQPPGGIPWEQAQSLNRAAGGRRWRARRRGGFLRPDGAGQNCEQEDSKVHEWKINGENGVTPVTGAPGYAIKISRREPRALPTVAA